MRHRRERADAQGDGVIEYGRQAEALRGDHDVRHAVARTAAEDGGLLASGKLSDRRGQTYLKDNPLLEVPLRLETMGEPFGYSRRRPRQLHARH